MNAKTLTRTEAHELIDAAADDQNALRSFAIAWDLSGWWNDNATWTTEALREHVAVCATSDDRRSNGPEDDDDTGLENPADVIASVFFPGAEPYNTGGGCTALRHEFPDGSYVLVTDDNLSMPSLADDDRVVVGLYASDDQWIEGTGGEYLTLRDAAAIYATLVQS